MHWKSCFRLSPSPSTHRLLRRNPSPVPPNCNQINNARKIHLSCRHPYCPLLPTSKGTHHGAVAGEDQAMHNRKKGDLARPRETMTSETAQVHRSNGILSGKSETKVQRVRAQKNKRE